MNRLTVVTAVAVARVPARPPPRRPASSRSRDGATWKLTDQSGATLDPVDERSALGRAYILQGFPGFASLRVRAAGRPPGVGREGARWAPFLRLGAPTGTRYRVDLRDAPLWRAVDVTVASSPACAADARGRVVRGCVELALRSRKPTADAGVERLVFAPGIGLAEVVVQTIAGSRTYSLGGATGSLE